MFFATIIEAGTMHDRVAASVVIAGTLALAEPVTKPWTLQIEIAEQKIEQRTGRVDIQHVHPAIHFQHEGAQFSPTLLGLVSRSDGDDLNRTGFY
jgi:hypothetical protein